MGAGHGSYAPVKLLFPYSMLLTQLSNDTITYPLIALAFAQFPLYGFAIAFMGLGRNVRLVASFIALLHAAFAGLCFFSLSANFS